MELAQIHYELYVRHSPGAPWRLEMASQNRAQVVETAETLFAEGRVAAVRVSKETLDPETHEFQSMSVLSRGKAEAAQKSKIVEDLEPLCVSPQDLYSPHARERIGRVLEGWLARNRATPFELLHRHDLVERLDAAGTELQHAVQKIAVPEAQARGVSTHELIRSFQNLIERSIRRVTKDARSGRFPSLEPGGLAAAAARARHDPEPAYVLAGAVAAHLAPAETWSDKVALLLDLAGAAPDESAAARALAFNVLEQPLSEILESRAGLAALLGEGLDLGGQLAAMTRLAAGDAVTALTAVEPQVERCLPPLTGVAARLAAWLAQPRFEAARSAVARRIVRELMGPRRLRPASPRDEIELLRALGMVLTAAAGQRLPAETVQEAFAARSRTLVTSEFVEALVGREGSARDEAQLLIWLCENVVGGTNKRQAARYLIAHVGSQRFEQEMRRGADSASAKLAALASLQRDAGRTGLDESDLRPIQARFGQIGGLIEGDVRLCTGLAQASAPAFQRLSLLLRLAAGGAAPLGPAADRAREAALTLLRSDRARAELSARPEQLAQVRDLMHAAGLAA
jgi:hypothetical protein